MTAPLVVQSRVIDHPAADGLVDSPRDIQRKLRIVEAFRPGILVENPQDTATLAQDTTDTIEQHRFGIGEVVQNESNRPFASCVRARQLRLSKLEVT